MAIFFAFGCMETRSYQLSIRNELPTPVTACLTKTHSPPESGWISPEQAALPPHPAADNTPPGIVIPPGGTVRDGIDGKFDPRTGQAVLRIYSGAPGLNEMTAISSGSPRRVDVLLRPGVNRLVVEADKAGAMIVVPAGATTVPARP